jgi:excisionase family DNA binding protein
MSEELSKAAAAEYLGVSVRALERYTQNARVGVRYVKGRAKPTPVYATAELDRFKAEELEKVTERPATRVLSQGKNQSDTTRQSTLASLAHPGGLDERSLQAAQALAAHITAQVLAQVAENQSATNRQDAVEVLANRVVLAEKLLLTLAEAQLLTGLSRSILRVAIDAGELKARTIGRAWRIKRADLDRYVAKL